MKIVEVWWVDSMIAGRGEWMDATEIEDEDLLLETMLHRSCGYLLRETDKAVCLVTSLNWQTGDHKGTRIQGALIIPKQAITLIRTLKETSDNS